MNKYVEEVKMLTLPDFNSDEDSIGHITVEGFKDVPFEIKRIFYIFGKENVGLVRGRHANRKSEFVLFNISGKSKVKVIDEYRNETVFELNKLRMQFTFRRWCGRRCMILQKIQY